MDQAETLRQLMRERQGTERGEAAIAVYLAPEARRGRLFSPRELAIQSRRLGNTVRIRDESDPIASAGGSPEIRARLAVLTGDDLDMVACYRLLKHQVHSLGVKKMNIIVCGVDGEGAGRRVFARLFDACQRFLDVELAYTGTIARGEKIGDSIAIRNFLLHYQGRQEA